MHETKLREVLRSLSPGTPPLNLRIEQTMLTSPTTETGFSLSSETLIAALDRIRETQITTTVLPAPGNSVEPNHAASVPRGMSVVHEVSLPRLQLQGFLPAWK